MTRLRAEGALEASWSVDAAADLVSALLTGTFTVQLIEERQWTTEQLREVLLRLIERALLSPHPAAVAGTTATS